jgi:S-adenosylmethionine decarboxylase
MYKPGLHIIATITTSNSYLLEKFEDIRPIIDLLITTNGLVKLGEVYHNFEPSGFTSVVCLSESHLSIHTWPEYNKVNLDIYLSNFLRSNDGTVNNIYNKLVEYFAGSVTDLQKFRR